jgi:hypothetical protein
MITPTFTLDLEVWFKAAPDKEESLRDLIGGPLIRSSRWKFNGLIKGEQGTSNDSGKNRFFKEVFKPK